MTDRYDITIRVLHWLMAALLLTLIAIGWWMSDLPKEDPSKLSFILLHKSLGVTALLLIIGRLGVRFMTKAPALPESIPATEQKAAKLAHLALYGLMIAIPLSGYVMSMASGYGIEWFGIKLHNYIGVDLELAETLSEVHEILPNILLVVVALHIAGVIKHRRFSATPVNLLPRISLCPSKCPWMK